MNKPIKDKNIVQLAHLYALFDQACPDLLNILDLKHSKDITVAANLIMSSASYRPTITFIDINNNVYSFDLNVVSKTCVSKGNWNWIKKVDIYHSETLLVSIPIAIKVLDFPYINNDISAYCLFKNIYTDLKRYLEFDL